MNKPIILLLVAFMMIGCDQIEVSSQIQKKEVEIETLKTSNQQLQDELVDLNAQVARLNVGNEDGEVVEELRKALTLKASELKQREQRLLQAEESLRLMKQEVLKSQEQFYQATGEKLEQIGEARQIKKEYETMQVQLQDANERASNWLVYISILLIALTGAIVYLVVASMRHAAQKQRIDDTLNYVITGEFEEASKQALAQHLGKRLGNDKK